MNRWTNGQIPSHGYPEDDAPIIFCNGHWYVALGSRRPQKHEHYMQDGLKDSSPWVCRADSPNRGGKHWSCRSSTILLELTEEEALARTRRERNADAPQE